MTKTVAIGGLGAIGLKLARSLDAGVDGLRLIAVAARDQAKADANLRGFRAPPRLVTLDGLAEADIVVEAAPAAVFEQIASAAIEAGRIFVPASVGALLPRMHLVRRAQETGARIVVPTGALLGLDAVRAAAEGRVDSVTIESRKPPRGLEGAPYLVQHGIDVSGLTAPQARVRRQRLRCRRRVPRQRQCRGGTGAGRHRPAETRVEIWADPGIDRNTHTIRVEAEAARFTMTIENVPSAENPRTGQITALFDAGLSARAGGDAEGRHVARMLAELLYFVSIALFGFVILGAAQLPNDMWLVAGIFPVFIAMIVGFMMWVYAWSEFGLVVSIGSLVVPIAAAVPVRRLLSTRDLFIAICVTVVLGLICARFAFLAADLG